MEKALNYPFQSIFEASRQAIVKAVEDAGGHVVGTVDEEIIVDGLTPEAYLSLVKNLNQR